MAAAKGASGYIGLRGETLILSPGGLGFNKLIEPDVFGDNDPQFKANVHYNHDQQEALIPVLQRKVDAMWPAYQKEARAANKPKLAEDDLKPDARAWLEDKLKDPSEKAKNKTPFIVLSVDADYLNRDKVLTRRVMRVWDGRNNVLDLASLGLGMGSIVQPVVSFKLFSAPIVNSGKRPSMSIKLEGLRVLKLERFTGGGPSLTAVSDDDLAGLEAGFEMDDLSAYAGGATKGPANKPAQSFEADLDDDIPF